MIQKIDIPNNQEDIAAILNPLVRQWFYSKFKDFCLPQQFGVLPIHSRENILISSPTGSGKTLTGFLAILNELVDSATKGILKDKVYAIYISPLKALGSDIQVNLLKPLEEIEALAGKPLGIKVATRTGDTTQYQRQKMNDNVPHILITTPESLALMLCSKKFQNNLKEVDWVIIDEIHAMAENKRGTHLSLLLEHLQHSNPGLTRVGLSATVAPLEDVAQYLVGSTRDCKIVDISYIKELDLQVMSPVKDLVNTDYQAIQKSTYDMLHELIQKHKTTLVFTNTRAATERVVHTLKQKFPGSYYEIEENPPFTHSSLIGAHHGSLSKLHRFDIEQKLRDGKLKAVVCSTSLELGIDIGSIDLVILLGSPKSVARALQRAGRAGHQLHSITKARILVMDRDDLVECAVLLKNALERKIDRIHIPENAYDVLVQHVLGFVLNEEIDMQSLYDITKQSYCYRNLDYEHFSEVVRYLAGEYQQLEDRSIFSKIIIENGIIRGRGKLTRMIYTSNLGTIPSSGGVIVKVGEGAIGSIDEGFLERLKKGDVFVLGGDVYEFKFARGMVAQVAPAYHKTPTVPRWFSETLPLSYDLATSIQRLRTQFYSELKVEGPYDQRKKEIITWIHNYLYVNDVAAEAIYSYMEEQFLYSRGFPRADVVVVEKYVDEIFNHHSKKHFLIVHSLHGRRTNEALSRVFAYALGKFHHKDIEIGLNDNGFYLATTQDLDLAKVIALVEPNEFESLLKTALENTEVLRRRFRQCAERSFMILRSYKGRTKRAGKQQVSSQILMKAAQRISKDFIILQESYREVLEDVMDIIHAQEVFNDIKSGAKKVEFVELSVPSPFATNLMLQGLSDIVSIEDKHTFLQQMHALVMAKIGGKKVLPSDVKLEITKAHKKVLTERQKNLIKSLSKLKRVPDAAKIEITKMIKGEEADAFVVEQIKKHKNEIRVDWPQDLAEYVFAVIAGDFDYETYWRSDVPAPISYETFWEEQRKKKEGEVQEEEFLLRKEFVLGAKKRQTPFDVIEAVIQTIDGKELRKVAIDYFTEEFAGTINKAWTDRVVGFIRNAIKKT